MVQSAYRLGVGHCVLKLPCRMAISTLVGKSLFFRWDGVAKAKPGHTRVSLWRIGNISIGKHCGCVFRIRRVVFRARILFMAHFTGFPNSPGNSTTEFSIEAQVRFEQLRLHQIKLCFQGIRELGRGAEDSHWYLAAKRCRNRASGFNPWKSSAYLSLFVFRVRTIYRKICATVSKNPANPISGRFIRSR